MWQWGMVAVAVAVLGAAAGVRAQVGPPSEPLDYAVFAGAEARVGTRVRVFGPVGSNDTVRIDRRAQVEGLVAAPTIEIGRKVQTGPRHCVLAVGGSDPCLPVTAPVVSPGSLGVGLVLPGDEDVEVPRRAHRAPLVAGAYKNLRLGRGSELLLLGGDYLFDRVALGRGATLKCAAACRVAVRRTLRIARRATVERVPAIAASEVRFDVTGHRTKTGARLGTRASLQGILWAPTTKVAVGRKARIDGSVQGAEIRIGTRARIGLAPEPPPE